jgi:hypothetical protein
MVFVQRRHLVRDFTGLVEDDERVAYAYLLEGQTIVADVWLYNRAPTPEHTAWDKPDEMPFLNPREYVVDEVLTVEMADDVAFEWKPAGEGIELHISVRGTLAARLVPGVRPGWSINAARPGPLALPL